jgi:hypothetical protein
LAIGAAAAVCAVTATGASREVKKRVLVNVCYLFLLSFERKTLAFCEKTVLEFREIVTVAFPSTAVNSPQPTFVHAPGSVTYRTAGLVGCGKLTDSV